MRLNQRLGQKGFGKDRRAGESRRDGGEAFVIGALESVQVVAI